MNDDILRSFLVSLGFTVDEQKKKKFTNALNDVTKGAVNTGTAITGIALSAQAMINSFSKSMENLFYASQRTGSSVKGIQALQSGAERVGVSAENALGMLEAMSEALNLEPGKRALLETLTGGKSRDLSNEKALLELLKELKGMPDILGFQYAKMFGIGDYKEYKNMINNLADLEAGINKRLNLGDTAKVNADEFAEAAREYQNILRDLEDKTKVIGQKIAINLLGPFKDLAVNISNALDRIFKIGDYKKEEKTWQQKSWFERMVFSWQNRNVDFSNYKKGITDSTGAFISDKKPEQKQNTGISDKQKYLSGLEKKYGLPSGLLDSVWQQESGRGANRYNAKSGAEGDFQFVKKTQKEFNLKNPYDFYESGDAAARKLKSELMHYNNDLKMALSAYNFGEGNLAKTGYLGVPEETRKYRKEIFERMEHNTINQKVDIHINSNSDPKIIAHEVDKALRQQNSEAIRNSGKNLQ